MPARSILPGQNQHLPPYLQLLRYQEMARIKVAAILQYFFPSFYLLGDSLDFIDECLFKHLKKIQQEKYFKLKQVKS